MKNQRLILIVTTSLLIAILICFFQGYKIFRLSTPVFHLAEVLGKRPDPSRHIFDFAKKIRFGFEQREMQLKHFQDKYGVEAVVVTVPSLEGRDIKAVAAEMLSNWRIGKNFGERGLLLLVAFKEKEVKLEVGYGAEAVFTDLFCGYIERMALRSFFETNDFDVGLMAIWEHFIARAERTLTDEDMDRFLKSTSPYLSGGAGVKDQFGTKKNEAIYQPSSELKQELGPQPTPEKVVTAYRKFCETCPPSFDFDFLTEPSKAMFRRYPGGGVSRLQCDNGLTYSGGRIAISEKNEYAVAVFYNDYGYKGQPLMLVKGAQGWQCDILSMRKWAITDHNNDVWIRGSWHPYKFLCQEEKYKNRCIDGSAYQFGWLSSVRENYEEAMGVLEKKAAQDANDVNARLRLAELYIDLTLGPKAFEILEQVIRIAPKEPLAYKYMAYVQRDNFGEAKKSMEFLEKYIRLQPDDKDIFLFKAHTHGYMREYEKAAESMRQYCRDKGRSPFCSNSIAFYYYSAGQNSKAKENFRKTLSVDPGNEYAKEYLRKIGQ